MIGDDRTFFWVHRFWIVGFMVSDMLLRRWFFFFFFFFFCGCGLIFLSSCGLILVVVVAVASRSRLWVVLVGCVK